MNKTDVPNIIKKTVTNPYYSYVYDCMETIFPQNIILLSYKVFPLDRVKVAAVDHFSYYVTFII